MPYYIVFVVRLVSVTYVHMLTAGPFITLLMCIVLPFLHLEGLSCIVALAGRDMSGPWHCTWSIPAAPFMAWCHVTDQHAHICFMSDSYYIHTWGIITFTTVHMYHTSCVDYHSYSDLVSGFPNPLASLDNVFANHLQSSTVTIVTSLLEGCWWRKLSLRMKMMLLFDYPKSL